MTVSELLPCAFCGGEAQIVGDERYGFCVVCAASDCTVAMGESYDRDAMPDHQFRTPDDAIAAWNRRTPPAQAAEAVERVARAIFQHMSYGSPVPWVPGLDSLRQDTARDFARAAIAAIQAVGNG